jgi:initiation factor 1A
MVKNSTGGNKSKKQARKTAVQFHQPAKEIRKAKEEGEIYAVVSKMFGGKECEVMCLDGKTRRCVMRSKFTFRGKAENNLSVGVMILVGVRDWEVRHTGNEKCDLLEVYSNSEKDRLKQCESCDFSALNAIMIGTAAAKHGDDVFSNYSDMDSSSDDEHVVVEKDIVIEKEKENVVTAVEKEKEKENVKSQVDWMIDEKDI